MTRTRASLHKRAARAVLGYETPIHRLGRKDAEARAQYMWMQGYDAARRDTRPMMQAVYERGWRAGESFRRPPTVGSPAATLLHVLDTQAVLKAEIASLRLRLAVALKVGQS